MNKNLTKPITMILAAIMGLMMAATAAHSYPFDAGAASATIAIDESPQELDASTPSKQSDASAGDALTPGSTESQTPVERAEQAPLEVAGEVAQDVRRGNWRHAVSGALALLMIALSGYREKIPWFKGDRGGAILVGILGLGGAFSTALAGNAPLDWQLFLGTFGVVWGAVGGYTWIKQIFWPRDKKESTE